MGQQEYEAFKAKLREWMNTHPDEYAAFEEAMNARDYAGCQSVIFQAMSLIPRYRRLMSDKANEGLFEHVDEIEQAARQHDLAGKIIRGVRTARQGFHPSGDALLALLRQEFRTDGGALRRTAAFARSGILAENDHECHDQTANLPLHQIRTAHQAGLGCPPRSDTAGRKRPSAGMGNGHSSCRRCR